MEPNSPKMIFKNHLFSSSFFGHLYSSLINISTEKFPWNKTDKTPDFNGIFLNLIILTMLEAIRTYQDGMKDEVLGNIIAELRKRGTFGGFVAKRIQSVLEVI